MMGVVRSLGRAKVPVSVFSSDPYSPARFSRYCEHHRVPDAARTPKELESVLVEHGKKTGERPILLPIGDAEVDFIASHSNQLRSYYQFNVSAADLIHNLINKTTQYEVVRSFGIPTPPTYFGLTCTNIASYNVEFPVVIKPALPYNWPWRGLTKAVSADNPHQLKKRLEELENRNIEVVVQSIIPGPPSELYTVVVYVNKADSAVVLGTLRKLRHFPLDFGFGSLNETVSLKPLETLAIGFLRNLGFTGVCGIEFKFDSRDGQFKFIEMNPRFELAHHLIATAGADVARAMYSDISGFALKSTPSYRLGLRWVSLSLDVKASRTLFHRGELNLSAWFRSLQGVRTEALLTWDDPLPGLCSYGRTLLWALFSNQTHKSGTIGLRPDEEVQW